MSAHEHLNPRLFDPGRRLSEDQLDARRNQRTGQELATFGEIVVSAPQPAAASIARSGSLRNQHETGHSMGEFDPDLRRELEEKMDYDTLPVYGALARSEDDHTHYGNLSLHLRSSAKNRAKLYAGDSLNDYWDDTGYGVGSHVPDTLSIPDVAAGARSPSSPTYEEVEYVEAHVLGDPDDPDTMGPSIDGATPARVPLRDVHRAVFHETGFRMPYEDPLDTRERAVKHGEHLHQAGVRVDHALTDIIEQPNLPMDYGSTPVEPKVGHRRRLVRHEDMAEQKDLW